MYWVMSTISTWCYISSVYILLRFILHPMSKKLLSSLYIYPQKYANTYTCMHSSTPNSPIYRNLCSLVLRNEEANAKATDTDYVQTKTSNRIHLQCRQRRLEWVCTLCTAVRMHSKQQPLIAVGRRIFVCFFAWVFFFFIFIYVFCPRWLLHYIIGTFFRFFFLLLYYVCFIVSSLLLLCVLSLLACVETDFAHSTAQYTGKRICCLACAFESFMKCVYVWCGAYEKLSFIIHYCLQCYFEKYSKLNSGDLKQPRKLRRRVDWDKRLTPERRSFG